MKSMGFNEARRKVIDCLRQGNVRHATDRTNIDVKNLLHTGDVSSEEVADIIQTARGNEHVCKPHHACSSIDVHLLTKNRRSGTWYIKWYFIEPNAVFISVHQ